MRPDPSVLWLMFRAPAGWIGASLLFGGAICLAVAAFLIAREAAFERDGARAPAEVVAKDSHTRRDSNGSSRRVYEVDLRFRPNGGAEMIVTDELRLSRWRALQVGASVMVEYLPTDPSVARLYTPDDSGSALAGWVVLAAGAATAACGAGVLAWSLRGAKRMRRLAREGEMVAAVVKDLRKSSVRVNNRPQYRLVYNYVDWRGQRHEGVSRLGPDRRFEGLKPGRGATIYIDRDDPTDSAWSGDLS